MMTRGSGPFAGAALSRATYRRLARPILRRCSRVSSASAKSIGAGSSAAPNAWFRRTSDSASALRSRGVSARSAPMSAVVGASGARDNTRRPAVVMRTDARRRSEGSVARSTHLCTCKRSTISATELRSVNVRAARSLSERLSSVRNCCRTNSCAALTPARACVCWACSRSTRTRRRMDATADAIGSAA
jgi:hypothetical protein